MGRGDRSVTSPRSQPLTAASKPSSAGVVGDPLPRPLLAPVRSPAEVAVRRWTCSVCNRRYTRLAEHVRDWHGWPFTQKEPFQGGVWFANPLPMDRLAFARPMQAWRFCAL